MIESKVGFMSGGRVDGYHFIYLEGTDFIICEDRHPDFVLKFDEMKKGENQARRYNAKVNRQLRKVQGKLKVAAPDLLAACEYTIKELKDVKGKAFNIMPILQAIKKAK